jgi:hypothetical protein
MIPGASRPVKAVKGYGEPSDIVSMGKKKMKLATWLVSHKLLSIEQANEVMMEWEKQTGHIKERFGRIAVKKGFITEAQLNAACLDKERDEATGC